MRLKSRRNRINSNVDMTPMIDIVFQLIVFFLVSTTFAVVPGIKLNLPQSRTAEGTSQGDAHALEGPQEASGRAEVHRAARAAGGVQELPRRGGLGRVLQPQRRAGWRGVVLEGGAV